MRQYAMEKGGHSRICTGAIQLKDTVVHNAEEKDLLFNANDYKSRYQVSDPIQTFAFLFKEIDQL